MAVAVTAVMVFVVVSSFRYKYASSKHFLSKYWKYTERNFTFKEYFFKYLKKNFKKEFGKPFLFTIKNFLIKMAAGSASDSYVFVIFPVYVL